MEAAATPSVERLSACPICGISARRSVVTHTFPPYMLNRCLNGACRTVYLNPRAPAKELAQQYDGEEYYRSQDGVHGYFDYVAEEKAIKATVRRRLLQATPWLNGTLLMEIGGALGFGCVQAKAMGFETCLVEISAYARQYAHGLGVPTIHPNNLYALGDETLDVIMAWDTLEHIYNLTEVIDEVRRLLKPGGAFLFNVPSVGSKSARLFGRRWWAYREPEHIIYLTPLSVRMLLGHKFELHGMWHDPQHMTLGGAAQRFGRLMPRWLAPTMGGLTYGMTKLLGVSKVPVVIPHGNRMFVATKK